MNASERRHQPLARLTHGMYVFANDVVGGFWALSHHSVVMVGALIVVAGLLVIGKPELRQQAELRLTSWLTTEQQEAGDAATPPPELAAVKRATAVDPHVLPREQARLTQWIARRYQVAPEPVAALVTTAYKTGHSNHIDPALILSVMAVESSFNPFAQSSAGAQGLMQVMTSVHGEKYDDYGGNYAAFDPLSNLRVGVWVLRDCIDKTGSTAGGLRCYVGAAHLPTDGGYVNKVLAEYSRMQMVVANRRPPPVTNTAAVNGQRSSQASNKTAKASKSRAAPVTVVAALRDS